jgi:uncharacterized protein YqeY
MSAAALKQRLREDLKAAMQAKAAGEVRLLRALVAALDNAEAVSLDGRKQSALPGKFGDGSNEVARRELSADDIAALLDREIHERLTAAADYERLGQSDEATRLREEAHLVSRYREA